MWGSDKGRNPQRNEGNLGGNGRRKERQDEESTAQTSVRIAHAAEQRARAHAPNTARPCTPERSSADLGS